MTTDELILCLERAADDSARLDLLDGLTTDEQLLLSAALAYRELAVDCERELAAERAAFDAFGAALAAAADDAERRRLIEQAAADPARGAEFLSAWHWQLTATAQDEWRRYSAMLRAG